MSDHRAAMEGEGFYNRHSALQAEGVSRLTALWTESCRVADAADECLTIVDYGSSQGRNSMAPIGLAIDLLRDRVGPGRPIEVIHTDLPSNDFASLFQALADEPSSYLRNRSNVFPAAIGRSYFDPIVPPRRVNLGWNTWTAQWMSRSPADAPDHVLAGMSHHADVLEAVQLQSALDWTLFLERRSAELRPGSRMLTAFTGQTAEETGWEWLLGELWASIEDLRRDGTLSPKEALRLTIPINLRTLQDIEAPFAGPAGGGLRLQHLELVRIGDPFWKEFSDTRDTVELGRKQAMATRAWAGPTLAARLDDRPERSRTIEMLFDRFAERIAANPQPHEPYMAVAVLACPYPGG